MEIAFASKKEINEIVELYRGWLDYKGILPDKLIEPESYKDLLKYFKKDSQRRYIITKIDNKVVGVCYIDASFLSLETIRLGDVFVSKKYRTQGIGTSLIKFAINYAKENKIKKIWLWTQEELIPAIKLYEKEGFIFEGKQKAQFCGKDVLLYGLILK